MSPTTLAEVARDLNAAKENLDSGVVRVNDCVKAVKDAEFALLAAQHRMDRAFAVLRSVLAERENS